MKNFKKKPHLVPDETSREIESLKEQLARALADYDNLSKRIERDYEQRAKMAGIRLIHQLLPVFDMLYGAQEHLNDAGLAIVIKELEDVLREEGVEQILPAKGELFNEEIHEAVDTVKDGKFKDNEIVECALRGYKLADGTVIRHAKVKVNKI